MATTATAVPYKRSLLDVLESTEGLSGVQLGYHAESGLSARSERIWLGRVEGYTDPAAIKSGRRTRNEEFLMEIRFRVSAHSPKPEANEERCAELLGVVENLFAEDAHLGAVDGVLNVIVIGYEMETVFNGKSPLTEATLRIQVKARLT